MLRSVNAKRNPEYLQATARAVTEFQEALSDFLTLHQINGTVARGMAPAVFPLGNVRSDLIDEARSKVDIASGRANAASSLTGVVYSVQGVEGPVDPIAAWHSITTPKPVLEPTDILSACGRMIGILEDMTKQAEAELPPTVGAEAMHPLIWGAARTLWNDGHYRQAVTVAAESLALQIKGRTDRNDVSETALWQETFSANAPKPGKPRLRWPGDSQHRDVQSMNEGLRQFAPGMQLTIRNAAAHGVEDMGQQEALERLAVLSLLARWVDECELIEFAESLADGE